MGEWLYEDEDGEVWHLGDRGQALVAHWIGAAYEWGGFDWDVICAAEPTEQAIEARWSLARFIDAQNLATDLLEGFEPETFWDPETETWEETTREGVIAVLLAWFITAVRKLAEENGVTPTMVVDDPLSYVEVS